MFLANTALRSRIIPHSMNPLTCLEKRTVRLARNHNADIFDDLLQRRTKAYTNTARENLQKSAKIAAFWRVQTQSPVATHIRLCKIGIRKCLKTLCFFAEIVYNSIRERLAKLRNFLFSLIIISNHYII